ncbi:MAG: hypothetical protein LC740_16840, partial [Actinobacteria bacterium]|nr:hypothetical protein [Actinomycetota bacterium]
SGAWFGYGDERLGQGRENAKQFLKENDEVRGRIYAEIYEKLGLDQQDDGAAAQDGDHQSADDFQNAARSAETVL